MITEQDYSVAAVIIGCDIAAIKAVAEVESKGAGFDERGRVKILFEPHIFWQQLKLVGIDPKKLEAKNLDLLSPSWNQNIYGKYSAQWDKLKRAALIHEVAAVKSASYGMFQIMGFNFKEAGYPNVWAFQNAMSIGEGEQLRAVSTLIATNHWDRALRSKDWAKFAESYNGSGYKANKYDSKLEAAYLKFSK